MSGQVEYLTCGFGSELKFAAADPESESVGKFGGHGAVFKNVDAYGDVIEPGAFAAWLADVKSGKQEWPSMLSQHGGWGMTSEDLTPVGTWLELSEDGHGLKVEGQLADTTRGNELYTLMKMKPRPAMRGMSIGYIPREFEMGAKPSEPRRKLKRIDVVEISLVTFPANTKAKVSAVKSIEALASMRDVEDFLRAGGMSKTMAEALIGRIKSIRPGDPANVRSNGGPGDPVAEKAAIAAIFAQRGAPQPTPPKGP